MRVVFCAGALLAAAGARASSIRDEISLSGTPSTAQAARSGSFSNLLSASIDVADDWAVNASARITVQSAATPSSRTAFSDLGGTVTEFSGGFEWEATDSWTVGVTLDVSPQSTISSSATVPLGNGTTGDALVFAASSNASVEVLGAYDTAGMSDLEWSFTGAVSVGRFETTQQIGAICSRRPPSCSAPPPGSGVTSGELRSVRISAGAVAIVRADTDVGLNADLYGYADDPATVGVFSVGGAARYAGAPIAPLRWLVSPEVAQRFGDLSLKVSLQIGEYAAGVGQGTSGLALKAQFRIARAWRAWITASAQRDVATSGDVSRIGALALGAAYRF